MIRFLVLAAIVVALVAVPGRAATPAQAADVTLLAVGDIASCSSTGDEATGTLVGGLTGTIAVLGDLAYESGSTANFNDCYEPSWGVHKARTKPSPGNHEYNTLNATGYYDYFNGVGQPTGPAGDRTKGYYSYDLGDWHLIALNSNCAAIGGCGAGSAQEQWLRADLVANPTACTLAYWHHPRFSSGQHGNSAEMQPIWQALYDYRAEIVLSGHDHTYERFALQTPSGVADPTYGIREFVVGTGGRSHYVFGAPKPNSEVREGNTYGVLQLGLHPSSYNWDFVPIAGESFTDSGSTTCQSGSGFDPDYDGAGDATTDNCPGLANPSQANADANFTELGPAKLFDDLTWPSSDNAGDACDTDDDNDGLSDAAEASGPPCASATAATNPLNRDTDGDRILDGSECTLGLDPGTIDAAPPPGCKPPPVGDVDLDNDGVADAREFCYYGTLSASTNSDGDGCGDGREVASVNADLTVNATDLSQLAQHFGPYMVPNAPHLIDFDITKDGNINAIDLSQVAQRFGPCP